MYQICVNYFSSARFVRVSIFDSINEFKIFSFFNNISNAFLKYYVISYDNLQYLIKNIDKNKYNIVIMSHILEHFTNPKYILNSIHNFTGGGGKRYLIH